jgi:septum formation inhibitor-activating ATPase MinD
MSYMSLFEQSARNSAAISLLNKMRHCFQDRQTDALSHEEKQAVIDALDILESNQLEQVVIHSFQGFGSGLRSSVLPLSMALFTASKGDTDLTSKLRMLLSFDTHQEQGEKEAIIKWLGQAIQVIGDSQPVATQNHFLRTHSKGL